MNPILGLALDCWIPPSIEMDDTRGCGQVRPRPSSAERENQHSARWVSLQRIQCGASGGAVHSSSDDERPERTQFPGKSKHPERLFDEL
jgi:hypothetical protein